ncbi:MAG: DUF4080 domain-containing protein [Clostridia bacterium]|nr:DUF4080 domain-containing protein [Clostridia bacterium]
MKTHLFTLNASHAHSAAAIRCLRNALRADGFEVTMTEATLKDRTHGVLSRLYRADAALYGFSCYIWNIEQMLAIAENLKALRPDARIVLGGPEVSFDTERFTALPFVDCVLTGEGEESIVTAARIVQKGEALPPVIEGKPFADFTKKGICYGENEPISSLVYYESSRGCPFSCAFCLSSCESGVRAKTAEDALDDLATFERFEQPLTVKLVDRTFNFDRERAKKIWKGLLSPDYTKCYHFEVAAHLLDEESFEILSRFPKGKLRLEIGLQSTNEQTLAAIARHTDAKLVLSAAKRLTEMGNVHVHLDLIAGLPYEGFTSFARSFDEAYFCCDVLQLGFLKLLHGTALRRDADSFGMVCEAKSPYTVLKTRWLSFAETERLHAVSDLCERLRDSGRFSHTLWLLLPKFFTPFAFFDDFSTFLERNTGKELQKISQRDLFSSLSAFAKQRLPKEAHPQLSEALRADFASAEVRKPPRDL